MDLTNIPTKELIAAQSGVLIPIVIITLLIIFSNKGQVVSPHKKYKTFFLRLFANLLDQFVMYPISALYFLVFVKSSLSSINLEITIYYVWYSYIVIMHGKFGQTLGKMACNVKIVDFKTEQPVSYSQAILREIIPILYLLSITALSILSNLSNADTWARSLLIPFIILSNLPFIWSVLEILTLLTNSKSRALHDFIAGTVVIRTNLSEVDIYLPEKESTDHQI